MLSLPKFWKKLFIQRRSLTKTEFRNWKNIKEKLNKHTSCVIHNTCFEKFRMSEQKATTGIVMSQFSTAHLQAVL